MNPRISAVRDLLALELSRKEELEKELKAVNHRIEMLRTLYEIKETPVEPDEAEAEEEGSSKLPSRMNWNNRELLRWIAESNEGRTLDELKDFAEQQKLEMSDIGVKNFVRNYKSRRYGLLGETETGRVAITSLGRLFLAQQGLTQEEGVDNQDDDLTVDEDFDLESDPT